MASDEREEGDERQGAAGRPAGPRRLGATARAGPRRAGASARAGAAGVVARPVGFGSLIPAGGWRGPQHRAVLSRGLTAGLEGYGPVPAPLARQWLRELPEEAGCWLRRLFVDPGTDRLVALESTRRVFTGLLRRFIMVRDRTCRTPWCDAPIRHVDHVEPAAAGDPTSAENAQGLCEARNYAKQAPGWAAATDTPDGTAGAGGARTPTGHRYHSPAPTRLPGTGPPTPPAAPTPATSPTPATAPTVPRPTRAEISFRSIIVAV
jgi:hypothetical protein